MNLNHHQLGRATVALGALLTAASAAVAAPQTGAASQTGIGTQPGVTQRADNLLGQSRALQMVSQELWGAGNDYKVHFGRNSYRYEPAFGSNVRENQHLTYRFHSVLRGSETVLLAGSAGPVADGSFVSYEHGGGVTELYEITPDGLSQSFQFDTPVPGHGDDLVVRATLTTSLQPTATGSVVDGLVFTHPDAGDVVYGAVTGVDANGWNVQGKLVLSGDVLELTLPGQFADYATYPIVLDPIVDTIAVESGLLDSQPDVAYDVSNNVYAVVWQQMFSVSDVDVRMQRFVANGVNKGNPIGPQVLIDTHVSTLTSNPQIANINGSDRFLVTYEEGVSPGSHDIRARAVDANPNGSPSSPITIASTSANEINADVGGERTALFTKGMVVWQQDGFGILGARIDVPPSNAPLPDPVVESTFVISPLSVDRVPHITKSGGLSGRWLVTFERQFPTVPKDTNIYTQLFDRNNAPVTPLKVLASTIEDETDVVVDGDGDQFFMVAHLREQGGDPDNHDILTQRLTLNIAQDDLLVTTAQVNGPTGPDDNRIAIGFTGEAFLLGFIQDPDPDDPTVLNDAYVRAVDPFNSVILEPSPALPIDAIALDTTTTTDERSIAIATQFHGDPSIVPGDQTSGDEAMLVWISHDPNVAFSGDVDAAIFKTNTGVNVSQGGQCGLGGTAIATGAVVANNEFTHRLFDAAPLRNAFLVMSNDRLDAPCGGCVLVPDPFTGFIGVPAGGSTDAVGEAGVNMEIPNFPALVGATVYAQWLVDAAGPGGCVAIGHDLSNAISIEIQ